MQNQNQNPQPNLSPSQMIYPQQPQIIHQQIPPNCCEKFSSCLTGTRNVPLSVFLIIMAAGLNMILCLMFNASYCFFYLGMTFWSSLGVFIFVLFVWSPMAIKIEKSSSTVRYGLLFLLNSSILSLLSFHFPLAPGKLWCFILFETLLISLANKDKKMKFFCCKVSGKKMIVLVLIYYFIFNCMFFYSFVITIIYTFVYKKWLMKKLVISNERILNLENWCIFRCLKNSFETFITLEKSQMKPLANNQAMVENNLQQIQVQPQIMNQSLSVNSSIGPFIAYPNYYSGYQPSMIIPQQSQIQVPSQFPAQAQGIPNIQGNINLAGEPSLNSSFIPNLNSSSYVNQPLEVDNQAK